MFELRSVVKRLQGNLASNAFVWGTWAVLSWSLVHYVQTFGVDMPTGDEWEIIPALTGHRRVTWKWLWSQHNEHRIFIPRLVYLAVTRAAHYDFRAGAYFNVFVLSASAAALIAAARRARGRTVDSDAFFAVALLHWGQAENLLSSFHVNWLIVSGLAMTILAVIAQPGRLGLPAALVIAVCTILLPLCGGNGLGLAPALAACVLLVGWQLRKAGPRGRWAAAGVIALGVVAAALIPFYFLHYVRPAKIPVNHDRWAAVQAASKFLVEGLGTEAHATWPRIKYVLFGAVAGISLAFGWACLSRPEERPRVARLVLFFAAFATLAVGIANARIAIAPDIVLTSRYASAAAPFWCAAYLAWEVVHSAPLRRFAQMALFLLAASFLVANRGDGIAWGTGERDKRQKVADDIQAGGRVDDIVARHLHSIYYEANESVSEDSPAGAAPLRARMLMLKEKKIGVFQYLQE